MARFDRSDAPSLILDYRDAVSEELYLTTHSGTNARVFGLSGWCPHCELHVEKVVDHSFARYDDDDPCLHEFYHLLLIVPLSLMVIIGAESARHTGKKGWGDIAVFWAWVLISIIVNFRQALIGVQFGS